MVDVGENRRAGGPSEGPRVPGFLMIPAGLLVGGVMGDWLGAVLGGVIGFFLWRSRA